MAMGRFVCYDMLYFAGYERAVPAGAQLRAVELRLLQPHLRVDLPVPGGQLQVLAALRDI